MLKKNILILFLSAVSLTAFSQSGPERTFQIPLKLPPLLSGNFAELRSNHFHSGIDFKTQGSIGYPVYSFDEGWVSRISVSPWGYGKALYISHHNGLTTVYAHLHNFTPAIDTYRKEYLYAKESFMTDIYPEKDEIPVKRGEIIAKSGNTGSSGGPHLHFEIRDTETQDPIDPIPYFIGKLKDTTKPELRTLRIYPLGGIVNGGSAPVNAGAHNNGNGSATIDKAFTAWGKIGLGIKAYDKMDSLYHIYGVKQVRLYVDDSLHFSMQHNRFAFSDTRYLNSLIDYPEWQTRRSMIMKLFVDPGNKLPCYRQMKERGEITINEERPYNIRLELSDAFGNKRVCRFVIRGKESSLPAAKTTGAYYFAFDQTNVFETDSFNIEFPQGVLYRDLDFKYQKKANPGGYADIHQIHDPLTPLHTYCPVGIKLNNDSLSDKSKYFLAEVRNGETVYAGGNYENGFVKGSIRTFGSFTVDADTLAPSLNAIRPESWSKTGQIRYSMTDKQSGIKKWRGEIDGEFALFEQDGKSNILVYKMDSKRIEKGKKHTLTMILTDKCGNEKKDERVFYW
ncbi:MAG: M23 family metallopeptidase [Bacteroidales bacterium]